MYADHGKIVRKCGCSSTQNIRLIKEAKPSQQELTIEFKQFKKLRIDVPIDY